MKKLKTKRGKPRAELWTPFVRMTTWVDAAGELVPIPDDCCCLRNNRYQVLMHAVESQEPFGRIVWLSIKRITRQPIREWRDLQRIKNEIVGDEVEAVEVFPAESRLVDTSNQYHLWCFIDGYRLPFGYTSRVVMDQTKTGAVQQPWPKGQRPADVMTIEEAETAERNGLPKVLAVKWRKWEGDE